MSNNIEYHDSHLNNRTRIDAIFVLIYYSANIFYTWIKSSSFTRVYAAIFIQLYSYVYISQKYGILTRYYILPLRYDIFHNIDM